MRSPERGSTSMVSRVCCIQFVCVCVFVVLLCVCGVCVWCVFVVLLCVFVWMWCCVCFCVWCVCVLPLCGVCVCVCVSVCVLEWKFNQCSTASNPQSNLPVSSLGNGTTKAFLMACSCVSIFALIIKTEGFLRTTSKYQCNSVLY